MIRLVRTLTENWALRRRVALLERQVRALEADSEDLWEIVNDRWADQNAIVTSLNELWEVVQPGSTSALDEAIS